MNPVTESQVSELRSAYARQTQRALELAQIVVQRAELDRSYDDALAAITHEGKAFHQLVVNISQQTEQTYEAVRLMAMTPPSAPQPAPVLDVKGE